MSEPIPQTFRLLWLKLYRAALAGAITLPASDSINDDAITAANYAAQIADAALEQYKQRFL